MPTPTVQEMAKGRRISTTKDERQYLIKGAIDEGDALLAMGNDPAVPLKQGEWDRLTSEWYVEEVEPGLYLGRAVWVSPGISAYQAAGSFSISFDISGQQQRITNSITTVERRNLAGCPDRDYGGAINVNDSCQSEGAEILFPVATLVLSYTVKPSDMTESYYTFLCKTVGKTNDSPFKGFDTRELLLTRVTGQQRDGENWDLLFGFGFSENRTNLQIGGMTIDKKGWEYLWIKYAPVEASDSVMKYMGVRATNCYVEQVYHDANYNLLGLP